MSKRNAYGTNQFMSKWRAKTDRPLLYEKRLRIGIVVLKREAHGGFATISLDFPESIPPVFGTTIEQNNEHRNRTA